jgi:hypothetical protein
MKDCAQCGKALSQYNPGSLCSACQKERLDRFVQQPISSHYDAEELAQLLGLQSSESVRRLARKGKLPPRIPGIRRCLWERAFIDSWIRSGWQQKMSLAEAMLVAQGLGWDIPSLTESGTNPDKLIHLVEEFTQARKRGDLRGWF